MAVDVLEGLLEEDDEVVQVSSDSTTLTGPLCKINKATRGRTIHKMTVSGFFPFPYYMSVC